MCFPSDKSFPDPRAGHTAVLMRHSSLAFPRLVVFGGNYHNKYLNSVYIMDIISADNFQWYKPSVKGTPPCPRSGHTCTHIPNTTKMLVFGGFDGKKCFNDLSTFTWTNITPYGTAPRPRSGHTASLVGDRFWVIFGGCSDAVFLSDFHILDLKGGGGEHAFQWLPQPSVPITISPRFHHSCDSVDHSVSFGRYGALFNDMTSVDVSPLLDLPDISSSLQAIRSSLSSTPTSVPFITATPGASAPTSATPGAPAPTSAPPTLSTSTTEPAPSHLTQTPTPVPQEAPITIAPTPISPPQTSESPGPESLPTPPTTQPSATHSTSTQSLSHSRPAQPPLAVLHAATTFNIPDIINLKQSSLSSLKLSGFQGIPDSEPSFQGISLPDCDPQCNSQSSALEICLTSAIASLSSEQQKMKEMSLYLARERAAHAALRADYASEQLKVQELEEHLAKTEKELRKSQKSAVDSKSHTQSELNKAHAQIASLRAELAKMTEKFNEADRRAHQSHPSPNAQSHQTIPQSKPISTATTNTTAATSTPNQALQQQLKPLLELCTVDNLDILDLPALMQLYSDREQIAAAKNKKIEQLVVSIEGLRLDLAAKEQQNQEALHELSVKYAKLAEEHTKEHKTMQHLVGEGLENMDAVELEKLAEIHHTGLKNVGVAKTRALSQQVARLQREKEELAERVVCVVCADAPINTILSPCGHRCMCKQCADLLSACPLCRKPISDKLQYFP